MNYFIKIMTLAFLPLVSLDVFSASPETTFRSAEKQTTLIELYTSEGCSSCPPADRWLSKLKNSEGLWQDFIPIAFHVDYWNYLGWKDRFSQPMFSQRQRQYKKQKLINAVYTPGFVVDGNEWRGWFRGRKPFDTSHDTPGVLELSITDDAFSAQFSPSTPTRRALQLNLAILAMDLQTDVARGENAGRELSHDFVVLRLENYDANTEHKWQGALPVQERQGEIAVVAWISEASKLSPIQAVGGLLSQTTDHATDRPI
jgi:hypothetical protein